MSFKNLRPWPTVHCHFRSQENAHTKWENFKDCGNGSMTNTRSIDHHLLRIILMLPCPLDPWALAAPPTHETMTPKLLPLEAKGESGG